MTEDMVTLTQDNLQSSISSLAYVLILFYHPSHQPSQAFLPQYSNYSQELYAKGHPIQFAKIDITKELDIARQYRVGDYPSIKLHVFGKLYEYDGELEMSSIVSWMDEKLELPEPVSTIERFEEALKENSVVVVYWNNASGDNFAYYSFYTFGFSDIKRIYTDSQEIKEKYVPEENMHVQISLFKSFDEGRVDYTGYMNEYNVKRFINQNKDSLIVEFEEQYVWKFFHEDLPTIILITSDNQESKKALDSLKAVAPQFKGRAYMTTIDHEKESGHELLKIFYEKEQIDFPLLTIVKPTLREPLRYVYDDTYITEKVIQQFFQDVTDKSIAPHYKSESAGFTEDELVHTIVGKTFKNIALDESKNVFVLFYAPWSEDCTEFIKFWEEFAELVKPVTELVIAKMNIDANEAAGVRVKALPSLVLYPIGNKEPGLEYYGERDLESIWEWLEPLIAQPEPEPEPEPEPAKEEVGEEKLGLIPDDVLWVDLAGNNDQNTEVKVEEKEEADEVKDNAENNEEDIKKKEEEEREAQRLKEAEIEMLRLEKEANEAEEERRRLEKEAYEREKERHSQMEKKRKEKEIKERKEREKIEKAANTDL